MQLENKDKNPKDNSGRTLLQDDLNPQIRKIIEDAIRK